MSFFTNAISRAIRREVRRFDAERGLSAIARAQLRHELLQTPRFQEPKRLLSFEQQVFSQGGEDGIVREIFRRIGTTDRRFVEFGVGDGLENNTVFLLQQGWNGSWIEGDVKNCERISSKFSAFLKNDSLTLAQEFITTDNAKDVLPTWAHSESFDLLSIDLDRNTIHIWRSLSSLRPRVAVIEYNAVWPADFVYEVPYAPDSMWNGSSHFGASLKAIEIAGNAMGYSLVGCDMAGTNAFLIRSDLVGDHFCAPFTAENHYEPIRYYLHGKDGHRRDVLG